MGTLVDGLLFLFVVVVIFVALLGAVPLAVRIVKGTSKTIETTIEKAEKEFKNQ